AGRVRRGAGALAIWTSLCRAATTSLFIGSVAAPRWALRWALYRSTLVSSLAPPPGGAAAMPLPMSDGDRLWAAAAPAAVIRARVNKVRFTGMLLLCQAPSGNARRGWTFRLCIRG